MGCGDAVADYSDTYTNLRRGRIVGHRKFFFYRLQFRIFGAQGIQFRLGSRLC